MIYLVLAILVIVISNIFKVYRLSLFFENYDDPKYDILTRALAIGNIINYVVPFKLGIIYRIWHSGKKTKYGTSLSFATIVVETIIDFICVSVVFIIFAIYGFNTKSSLIFYFGLLCSVLLTAILLNIFKKVIKKIIYKIARIFNKSIELKILKSSWFTILSFENIIGKVNKTKLLLFSILIWLLNILSCYFLTLVIEKTSIYDIFNLFFSNSGIKTSIIIQSISNKEMILVLGLYFLLSNTILIIISNLLKKEQNNNKNYIELLPHINLNERLNFLELYFNNNDNSQYFKKYLDLNKDVAIIEDYSAGSNATTILCSKDNKIFYRKYSFGKDANKLNEQIEWIENHKSKISLTKIENKFYSNGVCSYDMSYVPSAVSCFNYVHITPFEVACKTIKNVLDEIDKSLHTINKRIPNKSTISEYIESKVLKNIEKIEKGYYIKPLLKYEYIYINGKKYHNLEYFKKYLNKNYLNKVFENDNYSDIHGDFTIENIICTKEKINNKNFYIIDPNTGNIHDSPYLDYGKLLQSIHGGYEFLMNTKNVNCSNNKIEFLFTKSSTYYKLFDEIIEYLEKKFGKKALKSIFYHEIIHWLRLLPYKIEKNGERSLLFYAGLIMVCTDVEERFEKNETGII